MSYNIKNILVEVIKLAEKRRMAEEAKEKTKNLKDFELQSLLDESDKEKKLRDFLNNLDFETIKTIQTIMYLGRDKDYKKGESPVERYINHWLFLSGAKGGQRKRLKLSK
ncbi:DUF3775 domain-containing protein [Thermoanaerobacter siderophilus]|uniref:Uncharacterized protein n=1 Tax=Thermoanaerobacter siderophilus SR4 TaxID=880478 RepID=I9KSN3_9THEO|nr:DUF3775 domain-containing protein [Thermoanaerobacter siderophilus]EIV99913.1 hypothetical protein ThesiDRAFT1_0931 [Thermoanaerobacter siderophilus SR4]